MQPNVIFGHVVSEGTNRWGWFMGHFVTPDVDPRSTTGLEIKWAVHQAGESRTEWAINNQATTLSILINGQFCLQFEDREITLFREGDYVLWCAWVYPFANELVFANPVIMGILERVFYQEYVMVQLGVDVPFQGSDYQEIHRDFRPLFCDRIVTPLYALAVNFPLVEVTPDNGPFQMARGTHVLPREEGLQKIANGEIAMESFYMQLEM